MMTRAELTVETRNDGNKHEGHILFLAVAGIVVGILVASGVIEFQEGIELQEGGESSKVDEEESWGDWMYRNFYPKTLMTSVFGEDEDESTKPD